MKRSTLINACAAGIATLSIAGCNSNGTSPFLPVGLNHMYVGISSVGIGSLQVYSVPVTSSSVPTGTIAPGIEPGLLFVDAAGRLFVPIYGTGGSSTTVPVYTSPITSISTPAFNLTTTHMGPESVAEDTAGNVYVGTLQSSTCCVDIFAGPVNGSASASSSINANGVTPHGLGYPYGLRFDSSGNLYVSSTTSILKFTPPINSASVPAANVTPNQNNFGLATDGAGRVFVANATVNGTIDVFTQPFQNGSTRAFGLLVGTDQVFGIAFDGSGNLWCVDGFGNISRFTAPITSASTPTVILTVTNAYGIAFGP